MDPTILLSEKIKFPKNISLFYYGETIITSIDNNDDINLILIDDNQINDIDSFYSNIENRELKSIFNDRMGIILANLDSIYHFTGCLDSYYHYRSYIKFDYNIINATIGSIQYLQFRSYRSIGHALLNHLPNKQIEIDNRIIFIEDINSMPYHQFGIYLLDNGKMSYNDIELLEEKVQSGGDLIVQINILDINLKQLYNIAKKYRNIFMSRPLTLRVDDLSTFIIYRNKKEVGLERKPAPYNKSIGKILQVSELPEYELKKEEFKKWIKKGINDAKIMINFERQNKKIYDYYKNGINSNIFIC